MDRWEEELSYRQKFKIAVKAARICVFEVDLSNQRYTFFENSEAIFGVPGEQILREVAAYSPLPPEQYRLAVSAYFSHPGDEAAIKVAFEKVLHGETTSYEARMKAGNTKFLWCKVDVTPVMKDGVPVYMVGVITDIDDIKRRTDMLASEASLDTFSRLYNKTSAAKCIRQIFKAEPNKYHAMLLFDLDNFKQINDTYGHTKGDEALLSVSESLKGLFRETDVVGRFGGDEFIVLLRDVPEEDVVLQRVHSLLAARDNLLGVTKSVGVAVYPKHGKTYEVLLRHADEALYRAKKEKNAYCIYTLNK